MWHDDGHARIWSVVSLRNADVSSRPCCPACRAPAPPAGITGVSYHPGEQLLQSPQGGQTKQHMLHTQQSLQQRSMLRDSLHVRDQQQQHAQQQGEGGVSPGSSPRKGGSGKGSMKFKRRGVVADVCWMLQIRTFQVCLQKSYVRTPRPPAGIVCLDTTSTHRHPHLVAAYTEHHPHPHASLSACVCFFGMGGHHHLAGLQVSQAARVWYW